MKIYNTLTRQKEELKPSPEKRAGFNMFVCGPTVYDLIHIGNARTFIIFDVIAKYLRYRKYKLFFLQNITDIDDKIINRAKEEKKTVKEVAEQFEKEYFKDLESLGINSINKHARASEHIKEIIKQIENLIEKEYAYAVPSVYLDNPEAVNNPENKDVYFDISKFEEYGKLSKQNLKELESDTRIKTEDNKKDSKDFVIWKAQNYKYEPSWKSPWGLGRPGWHIEDTAISEKYLGQQYDIHCGGLDLLFPHHESEIALQEAASGKKPFVKYWLHSGTLTINGEKMSKSLGNFITTKEALKNHPPEAIRFFSISTHYRSPIDYSEKNLKQAEAAIERIQEFLFKLENLKSKSSDKDEEVKRKLKETKKTFDDFMDNDFSTPKAIASLFEFIREINPLIDKGLIGKKVAKEIIKYFDDIDKVLGIIPKTKYALSSEIEKLAKQREKFRKEKNYEKADELRAQIENLGYEIEDTIYGPLIRQKTKN